MGNSLKRRILVVLGTRPEAIKLSPLILALKQKPQFEVTVCTTGQHREMLHSALNAFSIVPDLNLELMTKDQTLGLLFGRAAEGLERILSESQYDAVVVQGDTTTCASAGLVSFYRGIPVFHVEAGLRSSSLQSPFPEEFNRRVVSLLAGGHFCPTTEAAANLIRENVDARQIVVTGNTGIDALFLMRRWIEENPECGRFLDPELQKLEAVPYVLATLHRRESFGSAIKDIFTDLRELAGARPYPVILPLHPNPNVRKEALAVFGKTSGWLGLASGGDLYLCDPIDYPQFVRLLSRARLIVTDSGGIQEEATALGKPLLVCRERTERPEALLRENARLVPLEGGALFRAASQLLDLNFASKPSWVFGDGNASEVICAGMIRFFQGGFANPDPVALNSDLANTPLVQI